MIRRPWGLFVAALVGLLATGCASRHAPAGGRYFQPTAAQIGTEPNSYGEAVMPRHGLVVVQGDDLAYGSAIRRSRYRINGAPNGQASITISETLRHVVRGVEVQNRGYPGDTVKQSVQRWAEAPAPDLAILCFSYGDMAAQTPPEQFGAALGQLIDQMHARGATVFVVKPPYSADPPIQANLGSYVGTADAVGRSHGAEVFDADAAMARIKAAHLKTVAQTAATYQAIGADIAPYVKAVRPAAASPQTGQAGSGESDTVRASPANPS